MLYGLLGVAILSVRRTSPAFLWTGLYALTLAAAGGGLWFTALQFFVIQSLCPYCLSIHAFGIALAMLLLLDLSRTPPIVPFSRVRVAGGATLIALTGLAVLIAGQVQTRYTLRIDLIDARAPATSEVSKQLQHSAIPPRPIDADVPAIVRSSRSVSLLNDRLQLTLGEYPVIGSLDAEHIIGLMFDYTCPACRKMHVDLIDAQRIYRDQFAVVLFPVPLDSACNPRFQKTSYGHRNACLFAHMSIALWNASPEAFQEFDRRLFEPMFPPEAEQAWEWAGALVGAEVIEQAMTDPLYVKMLDFSINLFYSPLIEEKVLPALLTPKGVRLGNMDTAEELHRYLEETLGLTPLAAD